MELIDTHCHLTFDELQTDIEAVLARSIDASVTGWITVGTEPTENSKVIELIDKHKNLFGAVGIHPHDARLVTDPQIKELKKQINNLKIVAVGETGLDFHYNLSEPRQQKKVFVQHLKIAAESGLPVIIHCRDAFDDTLEILDRFSEDLKSVVFHCFTGTKQQAQVLLDKGFFISITGIVTFNNADDIREAVKIIPTDRLMVETDCPFMSPKPLRNKKVNEPAFMVHTAEKIAQVKEMGLEQLAKEVTETSRLFFNLP